MAHTVCRCRMGYGARCAPLRNGIWRTLCAAATQLEGKDMITNDKGIVELKHFILREVCRLAWEDRLRPEEAEQLLYEVSPGPKPKYRCCIYKEREIVRGRIRLAMGKDPELINPLVPVDLVIDHSINTDYAGRDDAQELNEQQNALMAPLVQKAQEVVNEIAKAGGYIYVFESSQLLYIDPAQSTDLTPAARKALNIPEGRTLETLQAELQAAAQVQ